MSCERGWRGIRELSLFLAQNNLDVFVLIEGSPSKELRNMITPYSKIHNIFISEKIYSIYLSVYILLNLMFYKVYFFTSKKIKQGPLRLSGFLRLFFVYERRNSYHIEDRRGRQIQPKAILEEIRS